MREIYINSKNFKEEKMGNYNAQYESYYGNMINRRRNYNYGSGKQESFKLDKDFFIRRMFRDLIGVCALSIFILSIKIVSTPQTVLAYNYSKSIVNENFDYKSALSSIRGLDAKGLENKITDWIDNTKSKITGGKTLKEKLKSDFIIPVAGNVNTSSSKTIKDGIDIAASRAADVLSVYEGRVKEIGQDSKLGKYVVIDHGSGIETEYANLSDIACKEGDSLKKGQVIGKAVSNTGTNLSSFHFQLSYMGESLNPIEYLSFGTK